MDSFDPSLEGQAVEEDIYSPSSEGLAHLLLTEGEEPVAYGDALEEALPGSVDARLIEMSGAREARLSAETDRLQRELAQTTERQRAEREIEGKFLREQAARTESELRAALGQERQMRLRREAELSSTLQALAADHKRLKAVNVLLEQEAAGARSRLTAFAASSTAESSGLAAQNEELGKRLAALLERMQEFERAHHDKISELEAEAERRHSEVRFQEELVRQSHETAAAEAKRAEEAEQARRGLEKALADAELDAVRRLEARHRGETAERVKEAVDAARASDGLAAEERLARMQEELTERLRREADQALKRAVSEQAAANSRAVAELQGAHQKELREAVGMARAEIEEALRQENAAALVLARRDVETAKERELYALREKMLQEKASIHEQAAHLRAEAERRLQEESLRRLAAAQDEWRQHADIESAAQRGRQAYEREKELNDLRVQKDAELASFRLQADKERERAEADAYKKAKREAEIEMSGRIDKMGSEWQRLKGRFEEELSRIRDEMKRRDLQAEDRIAAAEREVIRVKEEARLPMIRVEKELLAAAEEHSKLSGDKTGLQEALRHAGEENAAAAARYEAERKAAADAAKADKDAHALALADLRKDLEGKLKALDSQLREERKKTVELLAKTQKKEDPSFWKRFGK